MANVFLLCLILVDAFVCLTMASDEFNTMVSDLPAPTQAPLPRKLGNHHPHSLKVVAAPSDSPSSPPQPEKKINSLEQTASADPFKPKNEENVSVEGQKIRLENHHHSVDKSIAGGGVILGGLATTFLVAVFCYIRATGRHKPESNVEL